jgi:hypothetical protein
MKAFIAKGRVLNCPIVACLISENNYSNHDFNDSVQIGDVGIEITHESINEVEFSFFSTNFDDLVEDFNRDKNAVKMELNHGASESFYQILINNSVVKYFNKETLSFFENVVAENRDKYSRDIEDDIEDMYNDLRECERTGN